jgi:hypothetical protein
MAGKLGLARRKEFPWLLRDDSAIDSTGAFLDAYRPAKLEAAYPR